MGYKNKAHQDECQKAKGRTRGMRGIEYDEVGELTKLDEASSKGERALVFFLRTMDPKSKMKMYSPLHISIRA